jgi:dihydrofolate reductase / thymidylate synthase
MIELIVAMDPNGGIGMNNKLPWNCKEELKIFNKKTLNSILLVGRKTAKYLPYLSDRKIVCLSKGKPQINEWPNSVEIINYLEDIEKYKEPIFISGGSQIYKLALERQNFVKKIHLSIMKKDYHCDTFFDINWMKDFIINEKVEYEDFTHYVLYKTSNGENQYLDLIKNILKNGIERGGRNGKTLSIFSNNFTFDLRNGFPLLTTKKMFLRGIVEEFLFFLRGDTDTTKLKNMNINIWNGNTSKEFIKSRNLPYAEGIMGPMYGYQWRHFGALYILDEKSKPIDNKSGIDQLKNVIKLIKEDPNSRRILLTTYNPLQAEEGVLYPCHSIIIQFYVDGDFLDMSCYNRSQDVFLGVPYNISSSSLLLMFIAKFTNKTPRFLNINMGDTHIYEEHLDQVNEQIKRIPYEFPYLTIPNIQNLNDIYNIGYKDFNLENYNHHSTIKAKMIV